MPLSIDVNEDIAPKLSNENAYKRHKSNRAKLRMFPYQCYFKKLKKRMNILARKSKINVLVNKKHAFKSIKFLKCRANQE